MLTPSSPAPHAGAHCGARKKRGGGLCSKPAGWRTDHAGQGRCYLHGGASLKKHGRYSQIQTTRVRELIEAYASDPAPLDTLPELASARALFQDFIERYDASTAALIAWHSSRSVNKEDQEALFAFINEMDELRVGRGIELTDKQQELLVAARRAVSQLNPDHERPRSILDISDAIKHLDVISRIVDRVEKVAHSITYDQLKRFLFGVDRVLELRVSDKDLLNQVRNDLLSVTI